MTKHIILVGLGGAVGSILRYLTSVLTSKYYSNAFPVATFVSNILGCLLIGLFIGYIDRSQNVNPDLRFLFITGFCGGYTTFSAFSMENLTLFQSGNYLTAIAYIGASVLTGLLAVWFGLFLFKATF